MVGQGGATVIRLSRDSTNTPWGFRLQGGQETHNPLTVQRVSGQILEVDKGGVTFFDEILFSS